MTLWDIQQHAGARQGRQTSMQACDRSSAGHDSRPAAPDRCAPQAPGMQLVQQQLLDAHQISGACSQV